MKINQNIVVVLISLAIVSCETGEVESINLSDIIPESEHYAEGDTTSSELVVEDSTAAAKKWFFDNGVEVDNLVYVERRMLPDRFMPTSQRKYSIVASTDTVFYAKWSYADSSKAMNAFYNWMDCFGVLCKSVYIGESKGLQKKPFQVFVSDTSIVYIEGCEKVDFKKWETFHKNLGYTPEWNYVLEQRKYGKIRWYTYIEEEKVKYEK